MSSSEPTIEPATRSWVDPTFARGKARAIIRQFPEGIPPIERSFRNSFGKKEGRVNGPIHQERVYGAMKSGIIQDGLDLTHGMLWPCKKTPLMIIGAVAKLKTQVGQVEETVLATVTFHYERHRKHIRPLIRIGPNGVSISHHAINRAIQRRMVGDKNDVLAMIRRMSTCWMLTRWCQTLTSEISSDLDNPLPLPASTACPWQGGILPCRGRRIPALCITVGAERKADFIDARTALDEGLLDPDLRRQTAELEQLYLKVESIIQSCDGIIRASTFDKALKIAQKIEPLQANIAAILERDDWIDSEEAQIS